MYDIYIYIYIHEYAQNHPIISSLNHNEKTPFGCHVFDPGLQGLGHLQHIADAEEIHLLEEVDDLELGEADIQLNQMVKTAYSIANM